MKDELLRKITAVRRRTRDVDVLDICDFAERELLKPPMVISSDGKGSVTIKQDIAAIREQMDRKFDKTAYMRDYMRKRRAKNNG